MPICKHGRECLLFFVASVCELKNLAIDDDSDGINGRCTEAEHPGKYLKARRNAQTVRSNQTLTNDARHSSNAQTINASHNTYTQNPKPVVRSRSPKNSYSRIPEGIVQLFHPFSFFLSVVFFFQLPNISCLIAAVLLCVSIAYVSHDFQLNFPNGNCKN